MPFDDHFDIFATPTTDPRTLLDQAVAWLTTAGLQILIILVVASALSAISSWAIKRFFRTMIDSSSRLSTAAGLVVKQRDPKTAKAAQARRKQRVETLSTVGRNIVRTVIWAVAFIMILDKFGVNIAPVIASLGVVGLAAGIGAQNIIKDVIAGILMLLEDIVAVGDTVDLEYATGTVENINLRVTQIRADDGVLWTVRNGEVIRIGNMSRGFSRAIVDVDIAVDADNDKVSEILEGLGSELAQDSAWSDKIQGRHEASGILGVDGDRYQRRLVVEVAPGQQWSVEMELRRRARAAFRQAEIDVTLPRPAPEGA